VEVVGAGEVLFFSKVAGFICEVYCIILQFGCVGNCNTLRQNLKHDHVGILGV